MRVSFLYSDREKAKQVCDDIVGRFMTQSSQQAQQANEAAHDFMRTKRTRLRNNSTIIDQKLADFRQRNAGRLPEEMEMNAQQMNALMQRSSTISDQLNRNAEQHMLLDSNLRIVKDHLGQIKDITPQVQARNDHVADLDKQIQNLQLQIENMKNVYKDDFPDLQQARQQLAVLQKQREDALKQTPKSDTLGIG